MKKLLATIAAAVVGLVAVPTSAEAGIHIRASSGYTYVSGHASCGCPIYTKRVIRGYDSYRRPVYNYYRQPFVCRCRTTYRTPVRHRSSSRYVHPRSSRSHGYGHRNYTPNRGGYSRSRSGSR